MLGYEGMFIVDSVGRKGGLMLLWKDDWNVQILLYSQGQIDCMVEHGGTRWWFTGFYGNPEQNQQKFSWELLRKLVSAYKSPKLA